MCVYAREIRGGESGLSCLVAEEENCVSVLCIKVLVR